MSNPGPQTAAGCARRGLPFRLRLLAFPNFELVWFFEKTWGVGPPVLFPGQGA